MGVHRCFQKRRNLATVCVELVGKGGWGMDGGTEKTGASLSPQVMIAEKSGGYIGSVFKIFWPVTRDMQA